MSGKTLAMQNNIPHPAVIAHRGLSYWAPEHTKPALELAVALNPDFIEFDVQRTKDGVLIAFHDDTLSRTTNISQVYPDRVQDIFGTFTYAELQQLDAGSWFNLAFPERASSKFVGLSILTFAELLDIIKAGSSTTGLYLETKNPSQYPGIEAEILATLQQKEWISAQYEVLNRPIILESFNVTSVRQFASLAPKIPRSCLVNTGIYQMVGKNEIMKLVRQEGSNFCPATSLVTPMLVRSAHQHNLLVHTYTVNRIWHMRYLLLVGVDGFFTDRAELGLFCTNKRKNSSIDQIRQHLGY